MAIHPKYKLEAPEGGWGYLVCTGMGLVFVSAGVGFHCFGLIFNDFLKSIGAGSSAVAICNSYSFGAMSIAGLFSNTLIQRFTKRSVGVAGSVLFCVGALVQIFAQSTIHLYIAAGMQGASFGLMIPIIFATFNHYFIKRRALMMSVTQSVIGIGNTGAPIIVGYLLDWYGFRGCVAIITAFSLHCILGMLIMHPVEWHSKKIPNTEIDAWEQQKNEQNAAEEKLSKEYSKKSESYQLKPLLPENKNSHHMKSTELLQRRGKLTESAIASRRSSLASYSNWAGSIIITEAIDPQAKTTGKWKLIVDFLDLTLLKQPVYVNIVLGITLSFYADLSFFAFHPIYLFELNYTKAEIAQIIAFGAGADLVSRCVLVMVSPLVSARYIYLTGAIFSIIIRYVFLHVYDYWSVAIVTAIIGFFKTWMHIPMPLIFAEYLPKERFSSGYGLFMFLQGMITFAIGPVVGYIRDLTNSYSMAFQFLNICLIINVFAWVQEILWFKCRGKEDMGPDGKRKNTEEDAA